MVVRDEYPVIMTCPMNIHCMYIIYLRSTISPASSFSKTCLIHSANFELCVSLLDGAEWSSPAPPVDWSLNVPYVDGKYASGTAIMTARRSAASCSSLCSLSIVFWRSIRGFGGITMSLSFSSINCKFQKIQVGSQNLIWRSNNLVGSTGSNT